MTPLFQEFNPYRIKWQGEATEAYENFDYSQGIYEQFYSGSVGSAKSIQHIHLIVRHLLENPGARILMLRRVLKDLKRTSWGLLLNHLADIPHVIKSHNKSEMKIVFTNGSEVLGDSYDKGDLEKFRSLELSGADFEEANECDKETYDAVKMRVGRIPSVKENLILLRTNPDEPSHWLYKYFIQNTENNKRQVFYSLTEQNPFLPEWYIENLKEDFDPLMIRRMLKGEWLSIRGKSPYYAYDTDRQYIKQKYVIDENFPLDFMHDFNIGEGKPMSSAYGQVKGDTFHIGKNFIVEGFNTKEILNEMLDHLEKTGEISKVRVIRIFGDRNGKNKDTRGNRSDYDIIKKELQNYVKPDGTKIMVVMEVPNENPPIRARQNIVNAHCMNAKGNVRLYVYKEAETVDEGLRLTKVKKGSSYQEDDSDPFQHVVTALGYYIYRYINKTTKRGLYKPHTRKR